MWLGQDSVFERSANSRQLSDFSLTAEGLRLAAIKRRGVEQRQLVGLITQRSQVRVLPPLPRFSYETAPEEILRGPFLFMLLTFCKHRERDWQRLSILGRLPSLAHHRTLLRPLLVSLVADERKYPELSGRDKCPSLSAVGRQR